MVLVFSFVSCIKINFKPYESIFQTLDYWCFFLVIYNEWNCINFFIAGGAIYSSDEDGSDFEAHKAKKTDKTKALQDSDEGSAASGSGDDDADTSNKSGADNDSNKSDDD